MSEDGTFDALNGVNFPMLHLDRRQTPRFLVWNDRFDILDRWPFSFDRPSSRPVDLLSTGVCLYPQRQFKTARDRVG